SGEERSPPLARGRAVDGSHCARGGQKLGGPLWPAWSRLMRIIAGALKGRRLQAPTWGGLRPSSDKLRETLFNVLAPRMDGARFLDGFGGTGAVGLEALSRGAAHVTFIERDPRACRLIVDNARRCGLTGGYTIVCGGVVETARREPLGPFDLVFLDPPYAGQYVG